ncbi:ComEA family DNA-binding protein [Ghiorsea bivora]|uniref:ComEA family DNA-binding protein n=1 Tax=Ghiorsea bivora TaxID=1485545 RepID=UPI000689654A|nr:helix-hairpin-helix domain-containing protein [Ghiorsea bivora]
MKKIMVVLMFLMSMMLAGEVYAGDMVNVNTATAAQLEMVKGVGPKTAAAIVAYRTEHGNFSSVAGLTAVKGVGDKKLQKIADGLTVDQKH